MTSLKTYQPTLKTNRFNFWLFYIPVGFASVLDNGIEISMGLINLLENYLWFIIYAEFISVSHLELH
jgi:uncharacterized membrane protein YccF (DUF307 family)